MCHVWPPGRHCPASDPMMEVGAASSGQGAEGGVGVDRGRSLVPTCLAWCSAVLASGAGYLSPAWVPRTWFIRLQLEQVRDGTPRIPASSKAVINQPINQSTALLPDC